MGGVYCGGCDIARSVQPAEDRLHGVEADAIDPDSATRLWAISAELTGVDAFAIA